MAYTIEEVSTKEVKTKFGMKPTYSIKADGVWYKCGFKKPHVSAGDVVNFSYTEGAYGKDIDMDSFKSASSASKSATEAPAASRPVSSPTYSGKGVFPIPPLDGQRAIVRQNSLTNAVNLLKDSLDKELTDEQNAERVISVARMFEAYSCGDVDLVLAKAKMAKAKAPKNDESEVTL